MAELHAFPGDHLAELAEQLEPGDTLRLAPGLYGPELFNNIKGKAGAPITILGDHEAIFDGGRRYEDVRTELNIMAYGSEGTREREGRLQRDAGDKKAKIDYIPSLGSVGQRAHIRIRGCEHLVLAGFAIRGAWPTCIAINQCQDITLAGLDMREGTFAIHVEGEDTHGITVHRCNWIQDISQKKMWHDTGWKQIHGDDFMPGDERGLDGDFFRSFGIRGGVTVRFCHVRHAFNAVHMYHGETGDAANDPSRNRDVRIHDNRFEFIRDNAIEAEHGATNWWVYRNDMRNVHKWLALEVSHSSHVYCFSNTCWFDSVPSMNAIGSSAHLHSGGGFFKVRKKAKHVTAHGPHYFFNNSAYIRTGYLKKGVLKSFRHFNNAIHCVEDATRSGVDKRRPFFWQPGKEPKPWSKGDDLSAKDPLKEDTGDNFTRLWTQNDISFASDIIEHPDIPQKAQKLGYRMVNTTAKEPGFVDPARGDLSLADDAPAARMRKLLPVSLALIEQDAPFEVAAPAAAGAWQGKDRLRLGVTVPGFPPDPVWRKEVEGLDTLLRSLRDQLMS